jgi:hypothetical protein
MKGVKVVGEVLHLTLLVVPESLELARQLLPMGLFSGLQLACYLLPMADNPIRIEGLYLECR